MDLPISRVSCGETFGLAAIEKLKRKTGVKIWSFRKKILRMEGGKVLRHYYDRNITTIHVCKFVRM